MLAESRILLIFINVYDGLVRGGLMLIALELSAELGYPQGESLALGFINALSGIIRYIIRVIMGTVTFTQIYDPNSEEKRRLRANFLPLYIVLMILFLFNTITAIILMRQSPWIMNRSIADTCPEEENVTSSN